MNKKFAFLGLAALVVVLTGAGCMETAASTAAAPSYQTESKSIEQVQQDLIAAVPIPTLSTSQERENIVKRATTFDVQNKVGYIYLVSYGRVMAFYTVDGKVSSLNSFVSPSEKLVDSNGAPCTRKNTYGFDAGVDPCYAVEAPDIDGAYGENDGGIFFFNTDGVYVEWHGDYLFVDEPLQFTTAPELVREIK